MEHGRGCFFQAEDTGRMTLIRNTVESWGLKPAGSPGPSTISADDIVYAEAFARAIRNNAERHRLDTALRRCKAQLEVMRKEKDELASSKEELSRQLEEAEESVAKAEERIAKAEERGERRGRKRGNAEARDFFRKVLITVASDFADDGYFDAYLKYVEEREKAIAAGGDPDEVEFPYVFPEETPPEVGPPEAVPSPAGEEVATPVETPNAAPPPL